LPYMRALYDAGARYADGAWDFSNTNLLPATVRSNATLKSAIARYWGLPKAKALMDPCRRIGVFVDTYVIRPVDARTGTPRAQAQRLADWVASLQRTINNFRDDYQAFLSEVGRESTWSGGMQGMLEGATLLELETSSIYFNNMLRGRRDLGYLGV